ncbi:uncharacterized protein KY384_005658 [Bacidia gigantensis]|uniref:uncharacterized protein n=1 Tax=Bacidia gigantensis TaxID=2732470 RepID=UPI001D041CB4|nr:uncharacterized protein KY384_005658 [Bacidia gigantensis]KAG8530175.1 hypothetical protein KY384_005658 [Bacidia gigantensis]
MAPSIPAHAFALEEKPAYEVSIHAHNDDGLNSTDDELLVRLGKKPVLRRRFGFLAMIGFTCTMLVTWEGSLILFTTGLTNGGSAGLVYGYLFVWLGVLCVFTTMAEMASIAPTAGGSIIGSPCSPRHLLWHGTLLFWATVAYAVFINTVVGWALPKIELAMLVLHVVGFLAVLIPLVACAPATAPTHDVFTDFLNGGNWPTQGLSFFVGLVGSVFAMFGCDATVHMAEEVNNAALVVPRAMLATTLFNGALGFAMIIAVLFVTRDVDAALQSPTGILGYPFMDIFSTATRSRAGASTMIALVIIMSGAGTIAAMATGSRLIWAFARDRGLPGSGTVSKLSAQRIPMLAVVITSIVTCLIGLINLGSAKAFNAVISLSVSSLFASYIIVETLMLYRRCTGGIKATRDAVEGHQLVWGPFHLPDGIGIVVNAFAVMFGLIIFFFSFWPVATPVDAATMNWSVLMTGSVGIFAVLYYLGRARKTFTGPIVETGAVDAFRVAE